jgi:hypothetical protein
LHGGKTFIAKGEGEATLPLGGLLDWIHGTSVGGDVLDDMKDEAEKHQVKERGGKALENAKQGGKEGLRGWNARRKSSKRRS